MLLPACQFHCPGRQDNFWIKQFVLPNIVFFAALSPVSLAEMKQSNFISSPKSLLIATYALCGFASFAFIGIQIGVSQLAPNQRKNLTEPGVKALIGRTISCLMCGCIAGMLF